MGSRAVVAMVIAAGATVAIAAPHPHVIAPPAQDTKAVPFVDPHALPGWSLYDRYCLACHGSRGDGHGPAAPWTWGTPRDFTTGTYEWRSTAAGRPPLADDVRAAIRWGAPGTSMPGFDAIFSATDIDALRNVLAALAPNTPVATTGAIVLGTPPPIDAARGAQLWTRLGCVACHGASGEGDGSAAAVMAEPPYDLTRELLRRPRAADPVGDPSGALATRRAAAMSIATGMTGTAMPGYADNAPPADLWALADFVVAIGARARPRDGSTLAAESIDADRRVHLPSATWPGARTDPDAVLFGAAIEPQGPPPAVLAPAQASLHARQCGRCHAKQLREWQDSIHAQAASPGLIGQVDHGLAPTEVASCQRCHAPLAEQLAPASGGAPAIYDAELRDEGVTCAGCHLRSWIRHGPARLAASLLPAPAYPLVTLAIYERADMCLACHQLPPRLAVAGKPLLNTYKEWLESPYMRRGIECQHCHMPNREHTFLGVHDPDTVRQSLAVHASAHRADGGVTVVAAITNVGAGHFLPTTSTPALVLTIELVDAHGVAIDGARGELVIGRDVSYDTMWHEHADTRIPPGATTTMARAWRDGRTADAAWARVTVEVRPDAYYEGFYATALAGKTALAQRALYEQALERARGSHYTAEYQVVPIAPSAQPSP